MRRWCAEEDCIAIRIVTQGDDGGLLLNSFGKEIRREVLYLRISLPRSGLVQQVIV
jgi:hypothetical protein